LLKLVYYLTDMADCSLITVSVWDWWPSLENRNMFCSRNSHCL